MGSGQCRQGVEPNKLLNCFDVAPVKQALTLRPHCSRRSFVIPIARAAGSLKRIDPEASEEVILYRTMLDLIKPKLVYLDLPLFMALLSDLFPGVELPALDGGVLRAAIVQDLQEVGLQVSAAGRTHHTSAASTPSRRDLGQQADTAKGPASCLVLELSGPQRQLLSQW